MKAVRSVVLALLLFAMVPVGSVSANGAACTGTYVGTSTYTNDTIDSKVGGGYWAYDEFDVVVDFYEVEEGEYCVDVQHVGVFTSIAGDSPQGTGTIGDGVTGDLLGGFIAYVSGTPNPFADFGHKDFMCDANTGVCLDAESWRDILFDEWDTFSFDQWAWLYTALCPSNGEWYNADTGNLGDITGEADFSCLVLPAGPIQSGKAKLITIPSTLRIGVSNTFEISFKSKGGVCDLRLYGGDLGSPIFAQMVPGSLHYGRGVIYASYSLSDLSTGATLVDFHGMDRLEGVKASCHGINGGTINDGGSVEKLTILNHTAP